MIDLKKITEQGSLYNFHSHTQFCDGHATMEDFVKEAIAQNFSHYGFSPHSPIPFESPCNMSFENVTLYSAEFQRLKEIYGRLINLYKSMEIDYINDDWGANNIYFDSLQLDYKISSIHFIPSFHNPKEYIDIDGKYASFKRKMDVYFDNDIEAVVKSFYRQTVQMIENGGFDIIGHFDKIGHNGSHFREGLENETWYVSLVRTVFDAIMDNNIIIEVNTKAWEMHNRFFPNKRFFSLIKKYNALILVNSDAHYPALVNAGRDEAMAQLNGL